MKEFRNLQLFRPIGKVWLEQDFTERLSTTGRYGCKTKFMRLDLASTIYNSFIDNFNGFRTSLRHANKIRKNGFKSKSKVVKRNVQILNYLSDLFKLDVIQNIIDSLSVINQIYILIIRAINYRSIISLISCFSL